MPDRPAVLSRSRHRGHRPRDYAFAIIITIIIIITTRNCDFSSLLLPAESKVHVENEGRTIFLPRERNSDAPHDRERERERDWHLPSQSIRRNAVL